MIRPDRLGSFDVGSRRHRRFSGRRRCVALRPWLQVLEDRIVLTTDTWIAATGGNWDVPQNWSLGTVPTASEDAVVDFTSIQTVTVSSTGDQVASLTTNADANFIDKGSLAVGADLSTFGGPTTVDSGSTLNFGAGASVQISSAETFSDNGALSFGAGDVVTLENGSALAVGGNLTASNATFAGISNTSFTVSSGGVISASDTKFGTTQLTLNSGSNDTLHFDTFTSQISINSGATINIAGNDFTDVGSDGVIAAGSSTATINLAENYWGSTSTTQIETLIDDHHVNSSLPTISFQPIWDTDSGTIATPETADYSPFDQTFNLSATREHNGWYSNYRGNRNIHHFERLAAGRRDDRGRVSQRRVSRRLLHAARRYSDRGIHDRGGI